MFSKQHPEVGARPGTIVIKESAPKPKIRLIQFSNSEEAVRDEEVTDLNTIRSGQSGVTWVDVQGYGNEETIREVAKIFNIHPLALEDIVNVPQRPKAEAYGKQVLAVTRMVGLDADQRIQMEQVTLLLGQGYVVTFQEKYGDILDPLRQRIEDPESKIRKSGADFLMYAIIDSIVDGYYPVIDLLGDHLEGLEVKVLEDPSSDTLVELNQTKNLLVNLRRAIWPQREAVNSLIRDQKIISDDVKLFLRDTYDHCVQSAEVIEMYREMATGLINIYLSSVANRSNEVMKVLTIMASIFIPLTFLAGIYGMNFEHMPELKMKWAYPAIWIAMVTISGGMFAYFWRKGWLGN
ncbi:MAG: magnesium/cobalt transporter CorA [Planctomycetota bacterium]